ncbi:MAG: DUF3267 domain-containing protein [Anaerolineaceae bacterium]|jgi:hypothetical protein|nr:DUF3267 domain-containing protein [Anaerolineaceae bacterium]
MKATQVLPLNYHPSGKFDLKSKKQIIILNLVGLVLLIFSIWFFGWLANFLRGSSATSFSFQISSMSTALIAIGKLLLTIVFVLVLHEGIHALFFWVYSRQKPVVGFKGAYAYAAMPGWYFPRNQFMVIGIAPLIVISLIGVLFLAILPISSINLVLVALVINTSGAVGDLFVVIWLLTKPRETFANDKIDSIEFYVPGKPEVN